LHSATCTGRVTWNPRIPSPYIGFRLVMG